MLTFDSLTVVPPRSNESINVISTVGRDAL